MSDALFQLLEALGLDQQRSAQQKREQDILAEKSGLAEGERAIADLQETYPTQVRAFKKVIHRAFEDMIIPTIQGLDLHFALAPESLRVACLQFLSAALKAQSLLVLERMDAAIKDGTSKGSKPASPFQDED